MMREICCFNILCLFFKYKNIPALQCKLDNKVLLIIGGKKFDLYKSQNKITTSYEHIFDLQLGKL